MPMQVGIGEKMTIKSQVAHPLMGNTMVYNLDLSNLTLMVEIAISTSKLLAIRLTLQARQHQ